MSHWFEKPFSLSAILGAETAAAEDNDNEMLALQLGELRALRTTASDLAHDPYLRCDHGAVAQSADPYSQIDVVIEQMSIPVRQEHPDVDVGIFD